MNKVAFRLMIITLLSKLFGFARDIILSYFYGASRVSDAYLISLTIPEVVFGFVATGISTGYIPIYSSIEKIEGEKEGNLFTNNLINAVLLLSGVFLIFANLFAPQLVQLFASGFDQGTIELAVSLTRISLFSIFFTAMISLFSSYLQLKGNFIIPALIGFPLNIVTILSIILSAYTDVLVIGVGILVAIISQVVILLPSVIKNGFRYTFKLDLTDKNLIKMIKISIPVIIGVSVNQINVLVDRTIASNIAVGGISSLNYGYMLVFFIQSLFVLPITQIMYPNISRMVANKDLKGVKTGIIEAMNTIAYFVIPATFGAILFAEPVVTLLYGRGEFGSDATYLTTQSLIYYAVGMMGVGLREIISRSFYSFQDTKTPMINATIGVIINVVLNVILSRIMGIGGLALATSISATITTMLLIIQLRKKIGPLGLKTVIVSFTKIFIASIIMAFVSGYVFDKLIVFAPTILSLIIAIIAAVIVYACLLLFFVIDNQELKKFADYIDDFKSKTKNNKQ